MSVEETSRNNVCSTIPRITGILPDRLFNEEHQSHLRVQVERRIFSCFHCGMKGHTRKEYEIWKREKWMTKQPGEKNEEKNNEETRKKQITR